MRAPRSAGRGFTLIELVILMVVMGVAAAALMSASGASSLQSAQMLRSQRMLSVATSLLNEVKSKPFTFCDPDRAVAVWRSATSSSNAACVNNPELAGAEAGQTRFGTGINRFNNVTDYNGYTMPGAGCASLCDANGVELAAAAAGALSGCSATVAVAAAGLGGIAANDGNGRPQSVRISVTVTCPGNSPVMLQAFRMRHAPNSP